MRTFQRNYQWIAALLIVALLPSSLPAALTQTGNVEPHVSLWTSDTEGYIGNTSDGSVTVDGGSWLQAKSGYLGYNPGSTGTATVTGVGSKWTNSYDLYVGYNGSGTLLIEAGGEVSSWRATLGRYSGSTGTATVTGEGSKWTNGNDLYVGYDGSGTLTVADGGEVSTKTLYASLSDLHGNGTITATGGAVLDADLTFDAAHGTTKSLAFGSGGTLNVTASGGDLGAGYKQSGSLTISEGVNVSSIYGYLGYNSGSTGTATVTGAGSKWTNDSLSVGYEGSGSLLVDAGGEVSSNWGTLGSNFGSSGTATVTGAGSKWTNSVRLSVGSEGTGTLLIEDGGQVSNSYGFLGLRPGSTGTATVTGVGSKWTNYSLYVGDKGSGSLTIEEGGLVSVGGTLWIDSSKPGDSFINMATGGMLALLGEADDSLSQFLDRVLGVDDALRYWSSSLADWAPLTSATLGVDYTLEYLTAGDLAGYTLLTVGEASSPGLAGDFNLDGTVDGRDFLLWQRDTSIGDLADWQTHYGNGSLNAAVSVPEPGGLVALGSLAFVTLLRQRRGVAAAGRHLAP